MKNPFKKKKPRPVDREDAELTVDDLIVLERYDEALLKLEKRLKQRPHDHHARLKLAEVLGKVGRGSAALTEYLNVAEAFAGDGFQDKALAIVNRALRMAPEDPALIRMAYRLKEARSLDGTREVALQALHRAFEGGARRDEEANLQLKCEQLWQQLRGLEIIRRFDEDQLARLLSSMEHREILPEKVVAERGEQKPELLLLLGGEIAAYSDDDIVLRSFARGKIIGDSALLERRPWAATYRTVSSTSAMVLTFAGLERCVVGNPDPPALLDLLRSQGNDKAIRDFVG